MNKNKKRILTRILPLTALAGAFTVFFVNASSLNDFPADGLKMSTIISRAYPEISCPQVIDLTNNGFTSVGSTGQNTQISKIVAISGTRLKIDYQNLATGVAGFAYMDFLVGQVSGSWGDTINLPGRITSVETIAPTSGDLLPADGLKITGDKLNADGSVNTSNVVGYIFFTGNVKIATSGGVASDGIKFLNTFYANTYTGVPFGRNIFSGSAPSAMGTERTQSFSFKCFNLNPVPVGVVTSIINDIISQ